MSKLKAHRDSKDETTLVLALETHDDIPAHSAERMITYRIGKDIHLSAKALEAYYWRRLEEVEVDLLLLTGLITLADRAVRRTDEWCRRFRLSLPVHRPELWTSSEVTLRLVDVLWFLTGDYWNFDFRPRKQRDEILNAQYKLRSDFRERPVVMPYSGGLDSFAGLSQFRNRNSESSLLLVGALIRTSVNALIHETTRPIFAPDNLLPIPVQRTSIAHAEQSFRTRAFFFFTIAALCARLAGADQVLVPENGQSSLGPSLALWGNEPPFRGTHPGFTYRLTRFLQTLWEGQAPQFNHANIWRTKGQILREVHRDGDYLLWSRTLSCGFDPRRAKGCPGGPLHCGICSNCLLRRLSLVAGGFSDFHAGENYFWKNLKAMSIRSSVDDRYKGIARSTSVRDIRMAEAAVENHACLARVDTTSRILARETEELAQSLEMEHEEVKHRYSDFLHAHRNEWDEFLSDLGLNSWVTRQAEANS